MYYAIMNATNGRVKHMCRKLSSARAMALLVKARVRKNKGKSSFYSLANSLCPLNPQSIENIEDKYYVYMLLEFIYICLHTHIYIYLITYKMQQFFFAYIIIFGVIYVSFIIVEFAEGFLNRRNPFL